MGQESTNTVSKVKTFIKDYGQMVFTVGSLVFASGSLFAKVQDVQDKADKLDFAVSSTQVSQARLTENISQLKESQKVQSESTNKLADAVNNLSTQLAKLEGQQERKRR